MWRTVSVILFLSELNIIVPPNGRVLGLPVPQAEIIPDMFGYPPGDEESRDLSFGKKTLPYLSERNQSNDSSPIDENDHQKSFHGTTKASSSIVW